MTTRALRLLYRDIPTFTCRARCTDCCGPVPWSADEIARVEVPPNAVWVNINGVQALARNDGSTECPFVQDGRCSVYDRRPFMCRLFGAVAREPRLLCPHGCRPDKPLTASRGKILASEYRGTMAP